MGYGHYTQQAREAGEELKNALGGLELNERALWAIAKLAKVARRSCRHNTAFNSAMSAAFPHASFSQTTKEFKGRTYQGLKITVGNQSYDGGDEGEED